jgi:hypothetical protein
MTRKIIAVIIAGKEAIHLAIILSEDINQKME